MDDDRCQRIIDRLNLCVSNRERRLRGTGKTSVRRAVLQAEIEAYRTARDIVIEETGSNDLFEEALRIANQGAMSDPSPPIRR